MKRSRILLIVTGLAFASWLGWLAVAVANKDKTIPLSRAQITASTSLIVCEVKADREGLPTPRVKVIKVFKSAMPAVDSEIDILDIRKASVPGLGFPGEGKYLIPIVMQDPTSYTIAGLPRSPGYEASNSPRPAIYPWTPEIEQQLKSLGYK